jgi:hypothetical protein
MPKFRVFVREVWAQAHDVEASTKTDAMEIVADGGGEVVDNLFEYTHTLDPDVWEVEQLD